MKKNILGLVMVLIATAAMGQGEKMKIVFDVSSADAKVHESAIRHVSGMSEAYPEAEFEMVIYSGALPMMLKDKSPVQSKIENLVKSNNVSLKVCSISLKRHSLTAEDLIGGVKTVPDAIVEIVDKQKQGWGYIKEAP